MISQHFGSITIIEWRIIMKIAIPVDDKTMETTVSVSFGRALYFLIYDTETKEITFVDNQARTSVGGAGIVASQTLVDHKVDALLTPRCGKNAADVLLAADVKIYKSNSISVKENIRAFDANELSLLDEIHSGFHGNRGI